MKGLIKKVRENKKGFTLAELLVVVAIVGILVAISIPVFTAQLTKARIATNQANMRAAKAAAVAQYMTDEIDKNSDAAMIYDYDLKTGTATSIKDDASIVADANKQGDIEEEKGSKQYKQIYVKIEPTKTKDTDVINGAKITIYAK